jgi:alpha,alpha-trehalase
VTNYQYKAVILDLDGVITQTARLHARAWKQMFDDYLPEQEPPFTTEVDYSNYVDGKPRYDGVSSFLESRGITLPQGSPEDAPGQETICGLGNRKNEIFLQLLAKEGVETYSDTVEQIARWRQQGVKTAVISSSRNCEAILTTAGLRELFDAKVDGVDSERLNLKGKPAPEIFWEAARQLGIKPPEAIVIEDAIAGIKAGVAGGFKLVVGVVRNGDREALLDCGADLVVDDLRELSNIALEGDQTKSSALDNLKAIEHKLENHQLALFTDYDGTLTPIVPRPEDAILSEEMRALLRELAQKVTVAVISGRDLADVQDKVKLKNLYYAGSHGFEIAGGTQEIYHQQEKAQASLEDLDEVQTVLDDRLQVIPGVRVERKKFAIAVHYRQVSDSEINDVESIVNQVTECYSRLRKRSGKKIWEIQPDIPWDKGRAIYWLLEQLELDSVEVLPMYLGDDTTDEDAFQALSGQGVSIRIGSADEPTQADYVLQDSQEVKQFLQELLKILE